MALTNPVLTISRSSLLHNIGVFRSLSGKSELAFVIKADSYGCGSSLSLPILCDAGIRTFFVAYLSEAIEVARIISVKCRIYVLADSWQPCFCVKDSLVISVASSLDSLMLLRTSSFDEIARGAAIHYDLGLNRYGIQQRNAVCEFLAAIPNDLRSSLLVLGHLSHADNHLDSNNTKELDSLLSLKAAFPGFRYSLSGSAGVINGGEYALDVVRAGVSLYGAISSSAANMLNFRNAISLHATVIQVKALASGSGIGYGHKFKASGPIVVGTAQIGYADGLPRNAADVGVNFISESGARLPLVGRVSMDLSCFIVSPEAHDQISPGTRLALFDDRFDINKFSSLFSTIPNEIMVGIGERVKRVVE